MPDPSTKPALKRPPRVGDPTPAFELEKLGGRKVNLATFKNRPFVLIFGSLSAPTFRENAAAYDDLRKVAGTRCGLLVVYTREAYPAGVWDIERNKSDGIAVPPHATAAAREAAARAMVEKLHLRLDVATDSMDDATAAAYGGFPNAAVVVDRDGKVVLRQRWADPFALREKIEALMKR